MLGHAIAHRPGLLILAWCAAVGAGVTWDCLRQKLPPNESASFLPASSPYNRAVDFIARAFPQFAHRSYLVIIAHRPDGLTAQDFGWIHRLAVQGGRLAETGAASERRYLSPMVPYLKARLVSPDNKAAMAVINLSSNYLSVASMNLVEQVEQLARVDRPAGLQVELTGPSGIGRDYFAATQHALDRTTMVTVLAVLGILVLVYRSPIGAMVPLLSIGASVYLAFVLLAILNQFGWIVTNIERIFAVVLLFGAGVDYALFWIARYREELQTSSDLDAAARQATLFASPAIVASAATTICGLCTLIAADLVPWKTAGKVLAPILLVSLLAALTLSPALARRLGRLLFWPMSTRQTPSITQRLFWPRLADAVLEQPRMILAIGTIALAIPAALALRTEPQFDSLSQLPPGSSSQRGAIIAHDYFTEGHLYSNALLLDFKEPPGDEDAYLAISRELTQRILSIPGVDLVYSLDAPLGRTRSADASPAEAGAALKKLAQNLAPVVLPQVKRLYLSDRAAALRLEILIGPRPFTKEAMGIIQEVRRLAEDYALKPDGRSPVYEAHLTGFTPYIMAVRDVSGGDQGRVMLIATGVIALIVFMLVRDWRLTLFMIAATWMTFGATLTIADAFFVHVMGTSGLDYKVRLIVFVIVMAVGQDYNIFLVSRLLERNQGVSLRETARQAILNTGPVISNCGLIMAATLGSLWAGKLALLQQTGLALALGILIDTFIVRPILLPSFFLALCRPGNGDGGHRVTNPVPAPTSPESLSAATV